jgi:WS/DGAT C-terminal domain
VDKADRVEQLRTVHDRLNKAKGSGQRQASSVFVEATHVIPFPLTAWAVRVLTRLPQRGVVTLATNVPGPRHRMRIMGRDVLCIMPIPPIALQLRTCIAILSYGDDLVFGITADYDATPDVDELAQGIERGVARLVASCPRLGVNSPSQPHATSQIGDSRPCASDGLLPLDEIGGVDDEGQGWRLVGDQGRFDRSAGGAGLDHRGGRR